MIRDNISASAIYMQKYISALQTALVAMKIANALPSVRREYDFEPAIREAEAALAEPPQ